MSWSLVRFLILLALVVLQIGAAMVCPDDWVLLGRSCYLFDTDTHTHAAATALCNSVGGRLLVQETQEEIELLKAFLNTNYAGSSNQFWIGLKSEDLGVYNYVWVNSAPLVSLDWASGEPDANLAEMNCGRYLDLNTGDGYAWYDLRCSNQCGLICELPETELKFRASVNVTVSGAVGLRIEQQVSGVALHTDCLRACIRVPACESLAYNPASHQCRMLSHNMDGTQHQDEAGWKTYIDL